MGVQIVKNSNHFLNARYILTFTKFLSNSSQPPFKLYRKSFWIQYFKYAHFLRYALDTGHSYFSNIYHNKTK